MNRIMIFFISIIFLLTVMACGRNSDSHEEAVIVATSPPLPATATPLPTRDIAITRPTMTPLPFTQMATPGASRMPSEAVETADVNLWANWYPPDGWETAVGPDGVYISPDLDNSNVPFAVVRRWANPVDINGWQRYLPGGEVETNGHVRLVMAGRSWDAVFIMCPDYACRAMFAVTAGESADSFSLLVYMPSGIDITSAADPQNALYAMWDTEAVKLNTTLQTLTIEEQE